MLDVDGRRAADWRVGVLFSQSGVTAAIERTELNATLLAIDEINAAGGVLGRPIQPVVYDPASNPKQFGRLAERLLIEDQVSIVFGCYMSSTRKAVLPVVEARDALLLYPTLYEGFEYSKNCIYTGAAPNQNSVPLARYLLDTYGNRFMLIGSNYIYPYESNRIMSDFVSQSGGSVLDEIYVPLSAQAEDFDRVCREIRKRQPDVIFSTVVGSGTALFYEAYRRAGFDPGRMPIASLTTSEAEIAEMTAEVAEGHITAAPYFEVLDTVASRIFVAAYKARFGADAPVTACAEAAYFQVHLAARAMAAAGTDRRPELVEALGGAEFDAPQGRVKIDADNNHTHLWPRVARVGPARRFEIIWNPGIRVKPDPYFLAPSLDEWWLSGAIAARS